MIGDLVTRDRSTDRAGFGHADHGAGADHQIALGLAVEFVDGEAERGTAPLVGLGAERLAAGADGAQLQVMAAARRRHRAQHAQRGRRDEGVAHTMPRHGRKRLLGIELVEALRHHGHAAVERRQQAVEQAAGPGPVGRRPEAVAGLRKEIVRHLDAGIMPEQHAMGMQRALGRPGGARGVDHHGGIVGRRVFRHEIRRGTRQRVAHTDGALASAVGRHDQRRQRRNLGELGKTLRIGDERAGVGIVQAIADGVDAEQRRERQRDGAELVDGDMERRHLGHLRQQDGDAIPARHAVGAQHVGEAVGGVFQPAVGNVLVAAGANVQDGEPARIAIGPRVACGDADVVALWNVPAERAIERVVVAEVGKQAHGAAS